MTHSAEKDATCKHCGLELGCVSGEGTRYYVHAEGPQRGLMTCAIDPYGFNAEPVGAECERICNGSRGIEPISPAQSGTETYGGTVDTCGVLHSHVIPCEVAHPTRHDAEETT